MDEKVFNKLISEYAMENANLRLAVITLDAELKKLKKELEEKKNKE